MSDQLTLAADRLISWIRNDALPLWSRAAMDPEDGFFEDLDINGAPRREQIRRVRVQPRQAYVYAHAAHLGWCDQGQTLSDHGFSYLLSKAATGNPKSVQDFDGFVHRLNPDGTVNDAKRDSYDHAFVLLACAYRIKAFQDQDAVEVANATLSFLDRAMGEPDGSFRESVPTTLPRRQNPHMHLFEAFLALYGATRDEAYLKRAENIYKLFKDHFFDQKAGVVHEFFTADWRLDPQKGHLIEPGHMMEWCTLLDDYRQYTGEDVTETCRTLYQTAEQIGRNPRTGWLKDVVTLSEAASPRPTYRTWVQTEYIRATLVMDQHGLPDMQAKAATLINQLFDTYLKAEVPGGYIDQYGSEGEVLSQAMPTSTLYHWMTLAVALAKV